MMSSIHQLLRQIYIMPRPAARVEFWVGVVGVAAKGVLIIEVGIPQGLQLGRELARVAGVDAVILGVGGDRAPDRRRRT
jgi:hypothetical protein